MRAYVRTRVNLACLIKLTFSALILISLLSGFSTAGLAVDKSRVPPFSLYKTMLKVNKEQGWVQFRNYDKRQLIYFTALQTLHCRLKEIRYSVNSQALDQKFELVPCNPLSPFALPSDAGLGSTLIEYPLGTVKTIAVQVTWENGVESEMVVYEPCPNAGDLTCAFQVKAVEADSSAGRALAPIAPADKTVSETGNERGVEPSSVPSAN
ncbi:MAG: hypothetical protein DHS20C08_06790 [Rhodomicrobium sp.]|nr:MAG: hypothetical protein DHS20C08_06790 [Rhodomicrobium sp.]